MALKETVRLASHATPMEFVLLNARLPMELNQTVPKINSALLTACAVPNAHQRTVRKEIVPMAKCAKPMVNAMLVRLISKWFYNQN